MGIPSCAPRHEVTMTLNELFKHGAEAAELIFKQQREIHPMWICQDEKGKIAPLVIRIGDKDETVNAVRDFIRKKNIISYVAMVECWMIEMKKGQPSPYEAVETLEDHPDRREAIHVYAEDRHGKKLSGRFYILRPEHGIPTLSPFVVDDKATETSGRFVNLFA